ncbi:MAG: CHAT domain-containing protein [Moorea sp. SIO2B7]|nr:CHAT domain-containing protein [Moorena sp. SIO2B7]
MNLCVIYNDLSRYDRAINHCQKALHIYEKRKHPSAIAKSLNNLGVAFTNKQEYYEAIKYYQKSLPIYEKMGNLSGIAKAFNNIAVLFEIKNQPGLAIIFYKQSVNIYEAIREDIKGLSTKQQQSYINTIEHTYRRLADLLIQQDRILEAQRVLDLLKIQELEDFIENVRGNENSKKGIALLPPEKEILSNYQKIIDEAIVIAEKATKLRQTNCETGINGQFGKGQEILGFGYLMQLAGARASLSSLWKVDDNGTQSLMTAFYNILKQDNVSKLEALRQAQIALIEDNRKLFDNSERASIEIEFISGKSPTNLSHPYYWSPFILIGNGF